MKPGPKVTPPFSETWEALEKCVEEGLIKSIGVSNFSPEKIQTFMPDAKIRPAVNQVQRHHPASFLSCTLNLRYQMPNGYDLQTAFLFVNHLPDI